MNTRRTPALSPLGRRASWQLGPRPAALLAAVYATAALVHGIFGSWLPGGRWLAVHLFTLGAITNAVAGFATHFAETLLRSARRDWPLLRLAFLNSGVLLVFYGMVAGARPAVIAGATITTAAVVWLYWHLRTSRRAALAPRFAFIVRLYERATGAFIHGAMLGALMGSGLVSGDWYHAVRLAHIHVMVLGWGGITLLATLVFLGPTLLRRRIDEGADERAATALRRAATGLSVGALALVATGLGGVPATVARLVAAGSLAVFALGATEVARSVLRVARTTRPQAPALSLIAAVLWLLTAVWADVVVVATGAWRYLDVVGAAALVGLLAQSCLAVLAWFAPLWWRRGVPASARHARMARLGLPRVVAFNLGVILLAVRVWPAAAGEAQAWAANAGFTLIAFAVAVQALLSIPMSDARS